MYFCILDSYILTNISLFRFKLHLWYLPYTFRIKFHAYMFMTILVKKNTSMRSKRVLKMCSIYINREFLLLNKKSLLNEAGNYKRSKSHCIIFYSFYNCPNLRKIEVTQHLFIKGYGTQINLSQSYIIHYQKKNSKVSLVWCVTHYSKQINGHLFTLI